MVSFSRKKLQIRMVERDVSAPQLAAALSPPVSAQAVHGWLKGESRGPRSIERLGQIAAILRVSINDLLEDDQDEKATPGPAVGETEEDYEMVRKLSQRLRWVREDLGMTVGQFAARYGVLPERWQDVEDGLTRPTLSALKRICVDLKINLGFLMFGRLTFQRSDILDRLIATHPEIVDEDPEAGESQQNRRPPMLVLPSFLAPMTGLAMLAATLFIHIALYA